jgi:hypothetical protein
MINPKHFLFDKHDFVHAIAQINACPGINPMVVE